MTITDHPTLPPELAERIAALDATIAECEANLERCNCQIEYNLEQLWRARAVRDAYLDAWQISQSAPEPQPDAPARVRHDVRGAVMVVLRQFAEPINETTITEAAGLPPESVHSFLLRAVRAGEIVREGETYRLPATQQEAMHELEMANE